MLTNYSVNNNQPAFGKFSFYRNAKEVLKKKLKTPEDLKKFQEICAKEDGKEMRTIDVDCRTYVLPDTFCANIITSDPSSRRKWYYQSLFQSPLKFLDNITKKADRLQEKALLKEKINQIVENNS